MPDFTRRNWKVTETVRLCNPLCCEWNSIHLDQLRCQEDMCLMISIDTLVQITKGQLESMLGQLDKMHSKKAPEIKLQLI